MTQSVALSFGGTAFAINPSDIAFAPVPGRNGICASGISSGAIGGANQWLVGGESILLLFWSWGVNWSVVDDDEFIDVFLKNVYFATDVGSSKFHSQAWFRLQQAHIYALAVRFDGIGSFRCEVKRGTKFSFAVSETKGLHSFFRSSFNWNMSSLAEESQFHQHLLWEL